VTVLPLVSTYPLFVVVLSALAERELPRAPRVLAAMGAIVAGAALVQVG
jgi:drug/metabolite transporter (DMT)-like permease